MGNQYRPVDLKKATTYPLSKRKNLIKEKDLGRPASAGVSFKGFLDSWPAVLAAAELKVVVESIVRARKKQKPVIFGMGAHVIKCGLSPFVIELIKKDVITAVAMNGAAVVHDVEIALIGETSEDVQAGLEDGTFGMAKETGDFINQAVKNSVQQKQGLGEATGMSLISSAHPFNKQSILVAGVEAQIPVTVHVAIGTDIVHTHPGMDGAAFGESSLFDFRLLTAVISELGEGGVYLNVGSAVIMPEVFLKALTLARNLGHRVEGFTTVNMDFIQHYRPGQNVIRRPTRESGSRGIALTGHHEIMLPLLFQAVLEELEH